MIDYCKRLVEVDEILNCLPKDEYIKIPNDIINTIKENKDKNYNWSFDKTKSINDQNINRDTIIILSYINMEYLLNSEQKFLMNKIYNYYSQEINKIKQEMYSVNNLFNKDSNSANMSNNNTSLTEYQKDNIFKKVIKLIKSILKI